ncbi:exported hypothetical protein [Alphaproteobacteria bacterium]
MSKKLFSSLLAAAFVVSVSAFASAETPAADNAKSVEKVAATDDASKILPKDGNVKKEVAKEVKKIEEKH